MLNYIKKKFKNFVRKIFVEIYDEHKVELQGKCKELWHHNEIAVKLNAITQKVPVEKVEKSTTRLWNEKTGFGDEVALADVVYYGGKIKRIKSKKAISKLNQEIYDKYRDIIHRSEI